MKTEEKVIELYEKVVIQAITPNQARRQFMELLDKRTLEIILPLGMFIKHLLKQNVVFTTETGKWFSRLERILEEIEK